MISYFFSMYSRYGVLPLSPSLYWADDTKGRWVYLDNVLEHLLFSILEMAIESTTNAAAIAVLFVGHIFWRRIKVKFLDLLIDCTKQKVFIPTDVLILNRSRSVSLCCLHLCLAFFSSFRLLLQIFYYECYIRGLHILKLVVLNS